MCILETSDSLLSIQDIHTYYGQSYVLQGLSFSVDRASIVAVLGRNGMGKTTLIRSIYGLTPPRSGNIYFNHADISHLKPYEITQRGMSLVPQGRRIFKHLTVKENLLLPTSRLAQSGAARESFDRGGSDETWNFENILNEFPQLKDRLNNYGNQLSGGEQQMLAIGRALISNPSLILMDEPSEGLSPKLVLQVGDILRRIKGYGHTVLLVEQNLSLALSVADYIYILSSGSFVFSGTAEELSNSPHILNEHLGVSSTTHH